MRRRRRRRMRRRRKVGGETLASGAHGSLVWGHTSSTSPRPPWPPATAPRGLMWPPRAPCPRAPMW